MVLDWDIHNIVEQKLRKQTAVDAKRMRLYVRPVIKQVMCKACDLSKLFSP
jgi:hypothetical protein